MSKKESTENLSEKEKPKKGKGKLAFLIILLIVVLAAIVGLYLWERSKPKAAARQFLDAAREMDFTAMEDLLQSSDMTALEQAKVTNEQYHEFFSVINSKMTYKIKKTSFNIANGTASVTAAVTYVDGTSIYNDAIPDILKQFIGYNFSGETLDETELYGIIVNALTEKATTQENIFTTAEITYPMIKVGEKWKVASLNDETAAFMSANFQGIMDEILSDLYEEAEASDAINAVPSEDVVSTKDLIDMATDDFVIHYTLYRITKDIGGEPCILIYYDYTNRSNTKSMPMTDLSVTANQNGIELVPALPENSDEAMDMYLSEIDPGVTVNVCQAFSLSDPESDVIVTFKQAHEVDTPIQTSQRFKVK